MMTIRPLLCAVFLSAAVPALHAQLPISLASSNGNASTQTAAYGITPSGAQTNQFLLTTINPASSLPANGSLGTTPANTSVATLNTYFGLANGTLAGLNAQDGSGYLSQQVTLTAGTAVRFDYIFLTNEDDTLPTTRPPVSSTTTGHSSRSTGRLTRRSSRPINSALPSSTPARPRPTSTTRATGRRATATRRSPTPCRRQATTPSASG